MVENPGLGISTLSVDTVVVPVDNYFRFGGHIAISGCRSMLQSLVDASCELGLVENLRFDAGTVMISVILSEI